MRNRMNLGGVVAVLLMTLVFLAGTAIPAAGAETVDLSGVPQLKETSKQRDERMQWWRDAKYGMFVHWGPCSLTGKDLSWSRGGDKPWDIRGVQNTHKMDPVYDNLYKRFDPVKFNADEFVKIAEDAGMKYMVLICKHHDGFSMFDTKLSEYSIAHTPYKKDIIKQFADACHKRGMKLGLYYSTRDWYHPDYLVGDNKKYDAFYRGQVEELLTNYGKVDVMWFDHVGGRDWGKWRFDELFSMMYRLQPHLIVNSRAAAFCGPVSREDRRPTPEILKATRGDFGTPEQSIGAMDLRNDWESCMTLVGGIWSYCPGGRMYSFEQTAGMVVECAAGGGNLLMNVGPMPTGQIEERQVKLLKQVGEWIKPRSEAIYGTRGGPFVKAKWGMSTHRGDTVYLFIKQWEGDKFRFNRLPTKVLEAKKLVGGDLVAVKESGSKTELTLAANKHDPVFTVIELKLEKGTPDGFQLRAN